MPAVTTSTAVKIPSQFTPAVKPKEMWMTQLINDIHDNITAIKNQERIMAWVLFGPNADEWIVPPNETNIESTLYSIYEYTKLIRSRMSENIQKLDSEID